MQAGMTIMTGTVFAAWMIHTAIKLAINITNLIAVYLL